MLQALLLSCVVVQPVEPEPLSSRWFGDWSGTLTITPERGDPQVVPMSLLIEPLKDHGRYKFHLLYGPEGTKPRDYELVYRKELPGRFEIDEKNGIRLLARLTGNALHASFQVGDALIHSRYELVDDMLKVEMTAFSLGEPIITRPMPAGAEVKSFRVVSIQTAELKRRKKSP